MKILPILTLCTLLASPTNAELLQGSTEFTLDQVEALQLTGNPSINPDQQDACNMQFTRTAVDGDINHGILQINYEIDTDTMKVSATGDYSYADGNASAKLDRFVALGIRGIYAFLEVAPGSALTDDYGVTRVGFTLDLHANAEKAHMLVAGGPDFMCKLSS